MNNNQHKVDRLLRLLSDDTKTQWQQCEFTDTETFCRNLKPHLAARPRPMFRVWLYRGVAAAALVVVIVVGIWFGHGSFDNDNESRRKLANEVFDEATFIFQNGVGIVVVDDEIFTYKNRMNSESLGKITVELSLPDTGENTVMVFTGFDGVALPVRIQNFTGFITPYNSNGELLLHIDLCSGQTTMQGIAMMPRASGWVINTQNLI